MTVTLATPAPDAPPAPLFKETDAPELLNKESVVPTVNVVMVVDEIIPPDTLDTMFVLGEGLLFKPTPNAAGVTDPSAGDTFTVII
ncbi:hypothetical protein [Bacillus thuringiensis]|uniref:hypothetical protein n=1 Tax=Bacillus thuringiensis TaxID=1428 RepID=UPI001C92ECA4|nr:hypothetical protein [Bacillus thuringiensis]